MIIRHNIEEMKEIAKDGFSMKFNCWGATQYALGQRKRYGWVGEQVMWRWINQKTEAVYGGVQLGDILVVSNDKYGTLIHTAVYVGDGRWFHKEGKFNTSFDSKKTVINKYTQYVYFWAGGEPKIFIVRLKK